MLCIRQRLWQSGPIFVVCSLVLVSGFLLQFRMLYTIHQKNHRIAEYKAQMRELYDTMQSVERVANMTTFLLGKLQKAAAHRKALRTKRVHKLS